MTEKDLYKAFKDVPYLFCRNHVVSQVGEAFYELTGYEKEQVLERQVEEVLSKMRATFKLNLEDIEPQKTEGFIFTKDLSPREVSVTLQFFKDKETLLLFKERADSRLEDRCIYAEQMCNDNIIGVGMFCVRPDIILLKANQAFLSMFQEPFNKAHNTIGKRVYEFVDGWHGSSSEVVWKYIIETKKPYYSDEYLYRWPDKGDRYYKTAMIPIIKNNTIIYVIETTTDITEQVMLKKQLEQKNELIKKHQEDIIARERAEKEVLANFLKMKDEFLSTITHEFKTPITVINAAIQAMELICKNELSEKAMGFLCKIRQNCFRQLRLVNNLLDYTRANNGKIKIEKKNLDIVFITKAITDSVYLYASQKGIRLSFSSSFKSRIIAIDEEKYERILLNILSNAIKFTPSGKTIIVSLRTKARKVCVQVKDTGIGIPEDKADLIFERFGQVDSSLSRRAEGTGIGLSLVKLLVEAMGGEISLKSKVGKGSCFSILLPQEKVNEGESLIPAYPLLDNRLIQVTAVEFSDIYLQNNMKKLRIN